MPFLCLSSPRGSLLSLCASSMSRALFRWVVAGSISLLIGSVAVLMAVGQSLPPELSAWADAEANSEWTVLDTFAAAMAVVSVVASVGLLFFARWSRVGLRRFNDRSDGRYPLWRSIGKQCLEAFFSELVLRQRILSYCFNY